MKLSAARTGPPISFDVISGRPGAIDYTQLPLLTAKLLEARLAFENLVARVED